MIEIPIGFSIKQINDKMLANADASLKQHGLTFSQVQVLDFLFFRGGQTTQREIEKHLGVSHPAVVGVVNRMVQAGFLHCFADEMDKRHKIVCVTEKAKAVEAEIGENRREFEKKMIAGMSEKETKEFYRLLMQVYHNLDCKMEIKKEDFNG